MHLGTEHPQPFTGTVGSLGYGKELAGSKLAGDWQKYFDPYNWQKETALGKQYQGALGGLFEQAGTGTMDLMSSWAGGGQTLSGRKGRQRKALGKETAYDAFKLGQGLDVSRLSERTAWEREQRSNLNTLLGMDIWEDQPPPSGTNPSSTWPVGTQTYLGESEFTGGTMGEEFDDPNTLEIRRSECEAAGGRYHAPTQECR